MPKVIGNPTVTPMAIPDWNQTDPSKADYIKNKPTKESWGLDEVDNTPDSEKRVYFASMAAADELGRFIRDTYATNSALKDVESIAKGANKSESFDNYESMIDLLNEAPVDSYTKNQHIMIITLEVPDLWISNVADTPIAYTYTTDEDVVNVLKETGRIQVGYYVLSMLETQKANLNNYPTKEELENAEVVPAYAGYADEAFFASFTTEAESAIKAGADSEGNVFQKTYAKTDFRNVSGVGARTITKKGFIDKIVSGDTVECGGVVKQGQTINDFIVDFPDGSIGTKDDDYAQGVQNGDEIFLEALDGSDFVGLTSKMLRNNPYTCNKDFRVVHTGHTLLNGTEGVQDNAVLVIDGEVQSVNNKIATKVYVDGAISEVKSSLSNAADKDLTNVTDQGLQNVSSREFSGIVVNQGQIITKGQTISNFEAYFLDDGTIGTKDDEYTDGAWDNEIILTDINDPNNAIFLTSYDLPHICDKDYKFEAAGFTRPNGGLHTDIAVLIVDSNKIATTKEVDEKIGNIETALDNIIAIQNTLIGGDSV